MAEADRHHQAAQEEVLDRLRRGLDHRRAEKCEAAIDVLERTLLEAQRRIEDLEAGNGELAAELAKSFQDRRRLERELAGLRIAYQAATEGARGLE